MQCVFQTDRIATGAIITNSGETSGSLALNKCLYITLSNNCVILKIQLQHLKYLVGKVKKGTAGSNLGELLRG